MSRVKRGVSAHRRHKKVFKQTKGFWGQRSNVYKRAHETLMRALQFAYIGRRLKKRDFRKLFITRINAAARMHDLSYSVFTNLLKKSNVVINRKMLSQLAIFDGEAFGSLVKLVKK